MKVFHILNQFLPNQIAGTEIYTWALCKQMQQHGVDVKVVIPNNGGNMEADYIYDGIDVHLYSEPSNVDRKLIMGFRDPEGLIHFEKYIRDEQPDIIHFHELAGSNGITLKHVQLAKQIGSKVIITFHLAGYSCKTGKLVHLDKYKCNGIINLKKCSNCYLHSKGYAYISPILSIASSFFHDCDINPARFDNKVGTALATVSIISKLNEDLKVLVSNCDFVISLTDWYEKILLANGIDQRKIKVIKQGLPFEITTNISTNKMYEGPLKLIFLGRINKFKGLHILIDAIRDINPLLLQLSIFGHSDDPVYESSLKIKTEKNINILWKGNLIQDDVVKTLQQHHVLCLCSTFSEMSPLVIQEAFAAGIPVIASNVYGNSEQIRHNHNGLLFDFNKVHDLRAQISRCIKEPTLLQDLTRNIKTPRSFKEVGKEYIDLYKSLLN